MENIFVIAAATGRTLVLPPPQTMYLLGGKRLNFGDIFPIHTDLFQKRVEVISSKEFLERETQKGGYLELDDEAKKTKLIQLASDGCEKAKSGEFQWICWVQSAREMCIIQCVLFLKKAISSLSYSQIPIVVTYSILS